MHIHSLFNSKKRVRKPKRGVRLLQRPRELGAKRVVERPEEVKAKIKLPKVEGIEEVVVSEGGLYLLHPTI